MHSLIESFLTAPALKTLKAVAKNYQFKVTSGHKIKFFILKPATPFRCLKTTRQAKVKIKNCRKNNKK